MWYGTLRALTLQPRVVRPVLLLIFYIVIAKFLWIPVGDGNSAMIFPPTGFVVAGLLLFGHIAAPPLFIADFILRIWANEPWVTAVLSAFANVFAGSIALMATRRLYAGEIMVKYHDTIIFLIAIIGSIFAVDSIASILMTWFNQRLFGNFWTTLGNTAIADIVSCVATAPLILLWSNRPAENTGERYFALDQESVVILVSIAIFGSLVFSLHTADSNSLSVHMLITWSLAVSFLIWVAVRFGREAVAGAVFVFAVFCALGGAIFQPYSNTAINNAAVAIVSMSILLLSVWLHDLRKDVFDQRMALSNEQRLRLVVKQYGEVLARLVDEIPVAIWYAKAPDFSEIRGNSTACNLLKIPQDERLVTSSDILAPFKFVCDGSELVHQIPIREVVGSGIGQNSELAIKHRDGSLTHVLGSVMPIRESDGTISSCVAAYIDVTERVERERAQSSAAAKAFQVLSRSEHHYRQLVELSPDAMLLCDADGLLTYTNQAAVELFGARNESELIGKPLTDLTHVDYHPIVRQRMKMLSEGQAVPPLEKKIVRSDGSLRDVEVTARRFLTNEHYSIELILRNITDRKQSEEAFRESEGRFRRIYEANVIGVAFSTFDGRLTDANQAFCDLTEYTPQDVRSGTLRWKDIAHNNSDSGHVFDELKNKDTSGPHELVLRQKNSKDIPVLMAMAVIRGTKFQIVTLVTDSSNMRRREDDLRKSEETYRTIIDNAADAIVTVDSSGKIIYLNQRAQTIFGYSVREVTGKPLSIFVADRSQDGFRRIRANDPDIKRRTAEILGKRKDGAEFPIEITLTGWNTSTESYVAANIRDITERKRAEDTSASYMTEERTRRAEAEHAERRATFLAEASAALASSLDYVATFSNLARLAVPRFADTCTIYLLEDHNIIRRLSTEHVNPLKLSNIMELERSYPRTLKDPLGPGAVMRTGKTAWRAQVADSLLIEMAKDKEHLNLLRKSTVKSYIIVPMSARGQILGVIEFAITESNRQFGSTDVALAEDLAHRAGIAVDNASLYREAQQALFTAQKAIKSRDELIAIVSHDLKNPLSAIEIGASTALKSLDGISHSANKMNRLISDLLDIASIDARNLSIRREPCEAAQIIDQVYEMLEPSARSKRIQLRREVQKELPVIYVDPTRIEQVISNLVGNSVKFTPAGGAITMGAERHGDDVCFIVSDTGPGIPPEHFEHVFDRHWQAKETAHLGTGLGLAIAKGIVESHGGQIWVTSNPGEGSSFYFTVPIAKASETIAIESEFHGLT